MEAENIVNFDNIDESGRKLLQTKEYEFQIKIDKYILKIDTYSNQTMYFYIKQTNNITIYYYERKFTYDKITKELKLLKDYYNDITKIFEFYDTAITMKKVTLKEDKENKQMVLQLEKQLDFFTIQCDIGLMQRQINSEEIFMIITQQINEMINQNNKQIKDQNSKEKLRYLDGKIKQIEKERNIEIVEYRQMKEQYQNEINQIKEELKDLKEEINNLIKNNKTIRKNEVDIQLEEIKQDKEEKDKNELLKDIKSIKEEINKINKLIENNNNYIKMLKEEHIKKIKEAKYKTFKEDPCNLKYKQNISNNNLCVGALRNFDIFKRIKDNIEYIVYNNKSNYNIDIKRINDKTIISSLKGHNKKTTVIRYYIKGNNEEYILSCDCDNLVIIWDIHNNYNIKYNIKLKFSGYIYDVLLLFNIFNKNYILISNDSENEYSKLYEFKDNLPFIRNIYGTNKNNTYYMIPWLYKDKYYIIECCYYKISINNMLEDECFANFNKEPEGYHLCGYIYNDNYLCVSDDDNKYIRI